MAARRPASVLVALVGLLAGGVAVAGPAPDAAAPAESAFSRDGFLFGLSLGPAVLYGGGELDFVGGVGGELGFRVGTTATPALLWVLELASAGYLVEVVDEANPDDAEKTQNLHSILSLGGQYYATDAVWFRAGVGVTRFLQQDERRGGERIEGSGRVGAGFTAGVGFDLFRRGMFAIDLESTFTAAAYRGAVAAHGTTSLGLVWY